MTAEKEKTFIYINVKNAKKEKIIRKILFQYCLMSNCDVVGTFIGKGDNCLNDLTEMLKRKRFSKIVIFKLNHFGNSSLKICSILDFINNKNKTVEVVIKKINFNVYVNDFIRNIKNYFGYVFDYKNRILYSKPNCNFKLNTSYSYKERNEK